MIRPPPPPGVILIFNTCSHPYSCYPFPIPISHQPFMLIPTPHHPFPTHLASFLMCMNSYIQPHSSFFLLYVPSYLSSNPFNSSIHLTHIPILPTFTYPLNLFTSIPIPVFLTHHYSYFLTLYTQPNLSSMSIPTSVSLSLHPHTHFTMPINPFSLFIHLTIIPPSVPPACSFSHHLSSFDLSIASCILPEHPSDPSFTSPSRAWSPSCMATFPPCQYPSPSI